ncbi:MAG: alpha/beta fold hydrolase [Planctomycetota bacterium]|nr:MAG: alpha/beta fold hydrolase [Planctomycetota bacterium]
MDETPEYLLGYQLRRDPQLADWQLLDQRQRLLLRGSLQDCAKLRLRLLRQRYGPGRMNLPLRTFGGRQLWMDILLCAGWRIQQHVVSGHARLLDPQLRRRAWGSVAQMRIHLETERLRQGLRWQQPQLVLLVHGILRSAQSMNGLARHLNDQGFQAHTLTYASSQVGVERAGACLANLIQGLVGIDRLDLVGHSMGSLVIRQALAQLGPEQQARIGRLVFLGPPSQGSMVAESMHDWWLYRWLTGPAGQDLRPGSAQQLAVPNHPTLVIAGSRGIGIGRLRGIGKESDGTVSLEEAQLPGATLHTLPTGHSFMMDNVEAQVAVWAWLRGEQPPRAGS